jgi:hypothetical protein
MITLTREEAQQVLEHLDDLVDFQQWDIDMHVTQYGEEYKPHRMKHMKEQLANTNSTIETLRARLAQETPYKVGQRLYREGKGISDIPTAVYSDSDIADALHGYETARRALHDMNKAAEQNGEEL